MKIAILGDSFGVVKADNLFKSWPELLNDHFTIDNFCECGIGEYKILQQVKKIDYCIYDRVIITHTSPYRVYVKHHPIHSRSEYHKNCDILLNDIQHRHDEFSHACKMYFKHIFDEHHACDMHNLICKEIEDVVSDNTLHITHFDYSDLYTFKNFTSFHSLWMKNKGPVNHYNKKGNQLVYQKVLEKLL